ncbi:MAG: ATP-binding protein [Myxococcota bacterium]
MDPGSTLRLRRVTGLAAVAWAIAAIGYSVSILFVAPDDLALPLRCSVAGTRALVEWSTPEAQNAGVQRGDRILSIDGIPMSSVLREGVGFLEPGSANRYAIEKPDGRVLVVDLAPAPASFHRRPGQTLLHVALLCVAALYLGAGGVVWWSRHERADAWAFMLFCSMMAADVASSPRLDLAPWSFPRVLANLPLLGASAFHLFSSYPIEPNWIVRHRRIRALPYLAALVLVPLVLFAGAFGDAGAAVVYESAFFFGTGLAVASLAIPLMERRRAYDAGIGARTDIMILAATLSLLPALLVLVAEALLQVPLPVHLVLLWVAIFPIAVGYGILRRQLFDFRIVARSSAAYGASTLAITGLFAFLITFADTLVDLFGVDERSVQVAFLFLAILAFDPLRDRMQRLVDQLFDRDQSRYRSAVREISEAMVSMLSLGEISDRILIAVTETMGVDRAVVLLIDERDRVLRPSAQRGDWDEDDVEIEIPADHPVWRQLWMRREELSRADFDDETDTERREACWDVFDSLEIELLVPILFGVDLLGVIAVGRKLSGERLTVDDRQLLRTLANQSAIAIENGKAFDEIAQLNETLEARVEERTRELRRTQAQLIQSDKLKSLGQLVAGVAHELNNPIGFVHANLQLLDEYLEKLARAQGPPRDPEAAEKARAAITKLLQRSREGTERVKQIVMDLRSFSRTDQAELQRADLHEEIERTLGLMEPRLKNKVEIKREYGEIPQVRCYPGQLNQVFMNLVMNACDAMGDGGTITIRTRPGDLGVHLEFADDGPGIPAEVRNQIFDPFFTTKPVGAGTGLGLSLSHGIIERHGGRLSVESTPGHGATFHIDLPLDAPPPDE